AAAGVAVGLGESTARAAGLVATGVAAGATSARVAALTEGVVKAMLIAKLRNAASALLGLVLLGAVTGGLAFQGQAKDGLAGGGEGITQAPVFAGDPLAAQPSAGAAQRTPDADQRTGTVTEVRD